MTTETRKQLESKLDTLQELSVEKFGHDWSMRGKESAETQAKIDKLYNEILSDCCSYIEGDTNA